MSTVPPADGDEPAEPEPCMACRGTGQVISHLGGSATTLTCPWCRGGGVRLSDVDAQQAWAERSEGEESDPAGGPAPGAAA